MHGSGVVAPQDQALVQQLNRHRLRMHIGQRRYRVPMGRFDGVQQGVFSHEAILLDTPRLA
jgi:hypothetical protein